MLFILALSFHIFASAGQYVESAARKMVTYSFACYCGNNVPSTLRNGVSVSNGHLLAIAGYDPSLNGLVVAFRGSDTTSNWFANIAILRRDYNRNGAPKKRCWVCGGQSSIHIGWDNAWNNFKDKIIPEVKTLQTQYPNKILYVTGHSMGGAMADIAALDFTVFYSASRIRVYSVGAPRWSNDILANWYTSKIGNHFRLANNGDPVVELPPSWRPISFAHTRSFINGRGSTHGRYLEVSKGCSAGGAVAGNFADQSTPIFRVLDSMMNVSITLGRTVQITVYGPADRWFAIGFGTQMIGSSAYIFSSGNSSNLNPSLWPHFLGRKQLSGITLFTNASGMEQRSNKIVQNVRILQIVRPLNGTSRGDYSFQKDQKEIPIVWAYSASASHQLTSAGHGVNMGAVRMKSDGQAAPSKTSEKTKMRAEIVGAVIGGVLVVCLCAAILFYIARNARTKKYVEMDSQGGYVPPTRS